MRVREAGPQPVAGRDAERHADRDRDDQGRGGLPADDGPDLPRPQAEGLEQGQVAAPLADRRQDREGEREHRGGGHAEGQRQRLAAHLAGVADRRAQLRRQRVEVARAAWLALPLRMNVAAAALASALVLASNDHCRRIGRASRLARHVWLAAGPAQAEDASSVASSSHRAPAERRMVGEHDTE